LKCVSVNLYFDTVFDFTAFAMATHMNGSSQRRSNTIRSTRDGRILRHIPIGDLILHTELRVATEKNVRSFRCPCRDCKGGRRKSIQVIRQHHAAVGRDPFLKTSLIGGDPLEGYPASGIWVEDVAYDDDVVVQDVSDDDINIADIVADVNTDNRSSEPGEDPEFPPLDEFHEVQRQVMEALDRGDALHEEVDASEEVDDADDNANDTVDGLEDLYREASTAVYPGSRTSIVSATIIIMNMCTVFRVSNKFIDELL
jgi:hypothetical protein